MAEITERERCDRLEAIQGRLMSYYHGHAKNRAEIEGEFSRNASDDMDWLVGEIARLIEAKSAQHIAEIASLRSRIESAEREREEELNGLALWYIWRQTGCTGELQQAEAKSDVARFRVDRVEVPISAR
jgi:hypothetical protein